MIEVWTLILILSMPTELPTTYPSLAACTAAAEGIVKSIPYHETYIAKGLCVNKDTGQTIKVAIGR